MALVYRLVSWSWLCFAYGAVLKSLVHLLGFLVHFYKYSDCPGFDVPGHGSWVFAKECTYADLSLMTLPAFLSIDSTAIRNVWRCTLWVFAVFLVNVSRVVAQIALLHHDVPQRWAHDLPDKTAYWGLLLVAGANAVRMSRHSERGERPSMAEEDA